MNASDDNKEASNDSVRILEERYRKAEKRMNKALSAGTMGPTAYKKAVSALETMGQQIVVAEIKSTFA